MIANPAEQGPFSFNQVVYAAPNLSYTAPELAQYRRFENPAADFVTRRLNISPLAELGFSTPWPFDATAVPLNGIAVIPEGSGPFPLALFAHGNHEPEEHSTPGYLYLCELLASHGIIAASLDVNFLNGFNRGENDGRAIIHLEHIRQFERWNETPGHPLEGKVDFNRILIAGHSRGGEAVGHASGFNRLNILRLSPEGPGLPLDGSRGLGPYGFNLRGIVAIAPTDQQFIPIEGPSVVRDPYLIIHGSRDGDVVNFPGYCTYDRSHPVRLEDPVSDAEGAKALVWVHGANHNFFNSVWEQESDVLVQPEVDVAA